MKLFLTGATGFIGGAIAHAAVSAGHQVTALVRSEASAPAVSLSSVGVALHVGDLREPQSFSAAAAAATAVIHAASTNDASSGAVDEPQRPQCLARCPRGRLSSTPRALGCMATPAAPPQPKRPRLTRHPSSHGVPRWRGKFWGLRPSERLPRSCYGRPWFTAMAAGSSAC
jgi:hypothetical protein